MKIERLDHIHVCVNDLGEATKFFEDILGAKFDRPVVTQHRTPEGKSTPSARTTFDPVGKFELITSVGKRQSVSQELVDKILKPGGGEGVVKIAFKVPDLEVAITQMAARGVRLLYQNRVGKVKAASFHPDDCHGVWIEFVEYEEAHPMTSAWSEFSE